MENGGTEGREAKEIVAHSETLMDEGETGGVSKGRKCNYKCHSGGNITELVQMQGPRRPLYLSICEEAGRAHGRRKI